MTYYLTHETLVNGDGNGNQIDIFSVDEPTCKLKHFKKITGPRQWGWGLFSYVQLERYIVDWSDDLDELEARSVLLVL